MDSLLNIDLISVGIAIAANIILGFVVFYRDRKNTTGRLFLLQTIILSFWSVANYFSYKVTDLVITLWIQRLVLFSAVPNSIVFLFLMHTFPKPRLQMPKRIVWLISFLAVATMLLTLTPFVFSGTVLIPGVVAPQPTVAPGMIIFALVAVLSIPLGIFFLIKKYIQASVGEKNQFRFLLAGVIIMFALIVTFNFIFPTFLQNTRFIPFSAVFTFPFVLLRHIPPPPLQHQSGRHRIRGIYLDGLQLHQYSLCQFGQPDCRQYHPLCRRPYRLGHSH